jgi:hypothetical protein
VDNHCKERVISLEAKEVIEVVYQLKVPSPLLAAVASMQLGVQAHRSPANGRNLHTIDRL